MMRQLLSLLICVFSITLHASNNDVNFKVQLLLADEALTGEITKIEPSNSWADYSVFIKLNNEEQELLLSNPEQRELFTPHNGQQIILINYSRNSELKEPSIILNLPDIAVYQLDDYKNLSIPKIIKDSQNISADFAKKTQKCSSVYEKHIKNLTELSMQKSVNYLFRKKPLSREQFYCLVSSIKSKKILKQRSFEPPFGANEWESHYFTPFKTRGELIAYILPHLMGIAIYPYSSRMTDKDREKLTEAWLYWGAVKFDQGAK